MASNELVVKTDRPKNVADRSALFLPRQKPAAEEDALLLQQVTKKGIFEKIAKKGQKIIP